MQHEDTAVLRLLDAFLVQRQGHAHESRPGQLFLRRPLDRRPAASAFCQNRVGDFNGRLHVRLSELGVRSLGPLHGLQQRLQVSASLGREHTRPPGLQLRALGPIRSIPGSSQGPLFLRHGVMYCHPRVLPDGHHGGVHVLRDLAGHLRRRSPRGLHSLNGLEHDIRGLPLGAGDEPRGRPLRHVVYLPRLLERGRHAVIVLAVLENVEPQHLRHVVEPRLRAGARPSTLERGVLDDLLVALYLELRLGQLRLDEAALRAVPHQQLLF